jgi:glyoxylase-like metal-dependent hydrolase (beta-lactamase superfamily II)
LIPAWMIMYVGKNVLRLAHQYGWQLEGIIHTHGHADHCGGNSYLQNKIRLPVYATAPEAALIENPELEPYYLYSAAPVKELQIRFLKAKPSRVASVIGEGPFEISGAVFEILSLKGHSPGHAGVVTPDDVCFLGDAI